MLSNPHWNAPNISSFEAWLETQEPSQTYPYVDCSDCACARYLKHVGKYEDRWLHDAPEEGILRKLNRLALGSSAMGFGCTFGELLARVRHERQLATAE